MSEIEIKGLDHMLQQLQEISDAGSGEALGKVVLAGAFALEGRVKRSMHEPKSGRIYSRGGKTHKASAPGEAPAIDYGALVNSVQSKLGNVTRDSAEAEVFTDQESAAHLEFGTAHIAPRPFMRPAAEEGQAEIAVAATGTIKRLIEEAAK